MIILILGIVASCRTLKRAFARFFSESEWLTVRLVPKAPCGCGASTGAYYIDMSIFFAYAIMYPDARLLVFYIFPIKAKVLGIISVIVMAFSVALTFRIGIAFGVLSFITVSMSLMNVILFFAWTRRGHYKSPKEIKRQREYKVKIKKASAVSRHKCAICGQTQESNPQLQFRYCSKCEGNYEYCSEHLFTHEHVKKN